MPHGAGHWIKSAALFNQSIEIQQNYFSKGRFHPPFGVRAASPDTIADKERSGEGQDDVCREFRRGFIGRSGRQPFESVQNRRAHLDRRHLPHPV